MDLADSATKILNFDFCAACGTLGDLFCCDGCPQSFHSRCVNIKFRPKDDGEAWYCPQCRPYLEGGASDCGRYQFIDSAALRCRSVNDIFNSDPDCLPQLDTVLQHLDWFVTPEQVRLLAQLFHHCPTFRALDGGSDGPRRIEQGVLFCSIVKGIRRIVSAQLFGRTYWSIRNGHLDISVGLSRSVHYGAQTCPCCGTSKESRYYCCRCGYIFSVKDELSTWSRAAVERCESWLERNVNNNTSHKANETAFLSAMREKTARINRYLDKTAQELKSIQEKASKKSTVPNLAMGSGESIETESSSGGSVTATETDGSAVEADQSDYRAAAALAGLDHMFLISYDAKTYNDYSGDHLFLMRTVFVASTGIIHDIARRYFEDLLVRWYSTFGQKLRDVDRLLDDVEAMHVLHQLRTPGSLLHRRMYGEDGDGCAKSGAPSENAKHVWLQQELFDAQGGRKFQAGVNGFCFGRPRVHNLLALHDKDKNKAGYREEVNDVAGSALTDYTRKSRRMVRGRGIKRSRHDSDSDSDSAGEEHAGFNGGGLSDSHGSIERIRVGSHVLEIDWSDMCDRVSKALRFRSLNDIVGVNLPHDSLPMTPKNYCTNCGVDYPKGKKVPEKCTGCNHGMRQTTDYAGLCDAIVFTYIFEDIGIDFASGSERLTLTDVVRLLPLARCYKRIDELGKDSYIWQCYFITHLIYVFSDWGQHTLSRQLFSEEFEFLVGNMDLIIRLKDNELVGEFLQCLKLLEMDQWQDEDIWHVMTAGYEYLIKQEMSQLGRGRWTEKRSMKDQYHTSYCASIGLQDYDFMPSPGMLVNGAYHTPRLVELLAAKK